MISSWSDFCSYFGLGLGTGFTVGFCCLMVRRVRISLESNIKRALW